jgi:hypothetical protein
MSKFNIGDYVKVYFIYVGKISKLNCGPSGKLIQILNHNGGHYLVNSDNIQSMTRNEIMMHLLSQN